jgi:anti-sigma B factor antagonist
VAIQGFVPELTVDVREDGGRTIVSVTGEVDMATAPRLRAYVEGVVALQRGDVVLDVSGVSFMDSTGIGVVMHAARQLAGGGHALVLRAPRQPLRRLLDITGIARVLEVEDGWPTGEDLDDLPSAN